MHKFDPSKRARLMSDERRNELLPWEFLKANGLSSGMTVADIGCGPGFFTLPAAEIVGPGGTVYAVDSEPVMVEEVKRSTPAAHVTCIHSGESSIPLGDGSCDYALLAFTLHEAKERGLFLEEVKRILKKEGTLLLLDWEKRDEERGPPREERIAKEEAQHLMEAAGFVIEKTGNHTPSHYIVRGRKRGEGPH